MRWTASKEISRRGERHRFKATADSEVEALLEVAVKTHQGGFVHEAEAIAGWVRSVWRTQPIPEILGITDAPIAPINRSKRLMTDVLDEWLRKRKRDVRLGTYQRDIGKVKNHIRPGLGHLYLEDLDEETIRQFMFDLAQKPKVRPYRDRVTGAMVTPATGEKLLGPSPLRDIYTILNLVLKDSIRSGHIAENPLSGVKRMSRKATEGTEDHTAAFDTFDKLIGDLSDDESRQFLLAFLGLRQSERLGLGRDSIQRRGQDVVLVIDRQLSREGLEVTPFVKTRASRRAFAVPESVGLYLLELVAWREREHGPLGPWDTLIVGRNGGPLRHQTDTAHWHKVLTNRGLPIHRGHLLRHWAATYLARSGVSEHLARGFLGHSDVLMTRYYTARDSLETRGALVGLADTLLPDFAYLNVPGAPALDEVRSQDGAAYHVAFLHDAIHDHHAAGGKIAAWEQNSDYTHTIVLDLEGTVVTYRGVIPAGIDPARLHDLAKRTWTIQ